MYMYITVTLGIPWVIPLGASAHPTMATRGRDKYGKRKGRKGRKHDPPTSEDVHDSMPAKGKFFFRPSIKKKLSGSRYSSQALDGQPLPDNARISSPPLPRQNQSLVSTSFTPASSDNVFPPDESTSDLQGELFHDDPEKVSRAPSSTINHPHQHICANI